MTQAASKIMDRVKQCTEGPDEVTGLGLDHSVLI